MDTSTEVSAAIKKQEKKIAESLIKKTHFSCQEIEKLLNLYRTTVVSGYPYILVHGDTIDSQLLSSF